MDKMNTGGIDIGGTFIKYGVINAEEQIIYSDKIPTAQSLDELVDQTLEIINQLSKKYGIGVVGIGIAGFIRKKDQCIIKSPNMPFLNGINFEKTIKKKVDIPVFVANDANLFALGEYSLLKEPRPKSFVNITLGTGLGGGIILNGKIWEGEGGFAAELGHVIVNPEGRTCGCGSRGCVETESTAIGVINHYKELSGKEMDSSLKIFELFQKGNPNAIKSFNRAGYFLGIFFTTIINVLNPAIISVGGGMAKAGDAIFKPAFAELNSRLNPEIRQSTVIKISTKKGQTGIIGAARFGREKL